MLFKDGFEFLTVSSSHWAKTLAPLMAAGNRQRSENKNLLTIWAVTVCGCSKRIPLQLTHCLKR